MLKEQYRYLTHTGQHLTELTLAEIVTLRHERENGFFWSARLSSGLFGLTDCQPGNRGPKSFTEVILARGDAGLRFLIESGFLSCPSCKPENVPGFWEAGADAITRTYGFTEPKDFVKKEILTFDSRRVNWEVLLPLLRATPNRLYLPQNLCPEDLITLNDRFASLGFELPPVGYYDRNSAGHFFEYRIPKS